MSNKAITRFELARAEYLEAVALHDTFEDERQQWFIAHGLTRETLAGWLRENDIDEMPSDLRAINTTLCEAALIRSDAYQQLVSAAQAITAVLVKRLGFKGYVLGDLAVLFDHMATRPYSPPSRKALDAILRVDVNS